MDELLIVTLSPPRFEAGRTLLVAGLGERYRFNDDPAFRCNGSASCRISATFRVRPAP